MLQRQQRDADCQHTFAERQHLTEVDWLFWTAPIVNL